MAANSDNESFADVFSQIIKTQIESLSNEQRAALIHTMITELSSPSNSPSPEPMMIPADLALGTAGTRRKKLKKIQARRSEKKKSVNAFMVFRSYYSAILTGLPQKARSPMLAQMWRTENRQSLFALLGAAYSKIRDGGIAPAVTLESFLQVVADKVSIIPAHEYLEKSGWAIFGETLQAVEVDEAKMESEYPLRSNLSPDDLITYSVHKGLIGHLPSARAHNTHPKDKAASNIAFAALPQGSSTTERNRNVIAVADFDGIDMTPPASTISATTSPSPSPSPRSDYNQSIDFVTADQQQTYEQTAPALHWHPQVEPAILGFDPNLIQAEFDPFSFVDFDMDAELEKLFPDQTPLAPAPGSGPN